MTISVSYSTYTEIDRFRVPVEKELRKAECFVNDILIKTFYQHSDDTDAEKYHTDANRFASAIMQVCKKEDIQCLFDFIKDFK